MYEESIRSERGVHPVLTPSEESSAANIYDAFARENVLREFLSDEQYSTLRRFGLLNEKGLRDYHIRKTFKELRTGKRLTAHHSIECLQGMYPYLQFDTLRKIVYQTSDREKQCEG